MNCRGCRARAAHRCDARRSIRHGVAANDLFVGKRMATRGCVDDELKAAGFEKIDSIGTAFIDFKHSFARQSRSLQSHGRTAGGRRG